MPMKKANEWCMAYFVSFSLDSFMIEVITIFFKLSIVRKEMLTGIKGCFSCLIKSDYNKVASYL